MYSQRICTHNLHILTADMYSQLICTHNLHVFKTYMYSQLIYAHNLHVLTTYMYSQFDWLTSLDFKVTWLSNLSLLSVPDEGYSRNASCALNLRSTVFMQILIHAYKDFEYWGVLAVVESSNYLYIYFTIKTSYKTKN